jgi:octaprenyl-diphosphate synthase
MCFEKENAMIPASQLQVLRRAVSEHPSAAGAQEHLDAIIALLADELPGCEALIASATRAPRPLDRAIAQLIFAGGKRIRPVMTLLITRACGGDGPRCLPLAAAAELVHSAALLHDDVIDEGDTRRGKAASRVLWGNLVSVLAGDLLLTSALDLILSSRIDGALQDMLDTTRAMIRGEVIQLRARGREELGVESYFDLIRDKTASLFAFACRSGARAAGAEAGMVEAAGRFGEHFGVAFQIIDDVLDLEGVSGEVGKQLGRDLLEGKTTLPLALALRDDPERLRPLVSRARRGDESAATRVTGLPVIRAACIEARQRGKAETDKGIIHLQRLPVCRESELLTDLAQSLAERTV